MEKKRLDRTLSPQNSVIGGSVAASEQSEEPPLTRLRFWAGAPTTRPRGEMLGRAIQLLEYQMVRALCRLNLVQTVAPGWRQIESEMALDLITIPAVSARDHEIAMI